MTYRQKLAKARTQFIQFSKGVSKPITWNNSSMFKIYHKIQLIEKFPFLSEAIIQQICRPPPSATEVENLLYDADKNCKF